MSSRISVLASEHSLGLYAHLIGWAVVTASHLTGNDKNNSARKYSLHTTQYNSINLNNKPHRQHESNPSSSASYAQHVLGGQETSWASSTAPEHTWSWSIMITHVTAVRDIFHPDPMQFDFSQQPLRFCPGQNSAFYPPWDRGGRSGVRTGSGRGGACYRMCFRLGTSRINKLELDAG